MTPLLSIKAVEAFLGVSRKTVLQAVRRGKLKASKVEHQWRFKPGDVDAYLEAQAVGPGDDVGAGGPSTLSDDDIPFAWLMPLVAPAVGLLGSLSLLA